MYETEEENTENVKDDERYRQISESLMDLLDPLRLSS
jgi:hypothetical protein